MASPRESVSFAFEAVPSSSTGTAAPVRIGRPRSMSASFSTVAKMYKQGAMSERERQVAKDLIIQGEGQISIHLGSAEADGGKQLREFLASKSAAAAGGDGAASGAVTGMSSELSKMLGRSGSAAAAGAAAAPAFAAVVAAAPPLASAAGAASSTLHKRGRSVGTESKLHLTKEFQRGLKTQRTAGASASDGNKIAVASVFAAAPPGTTAGTAAAVAAARAPSDKKKKGASGDDGELVMVMVSDGKGGKVMAHERRKPRRWTKQEDESLRRAVAIHGEKHWKDIARSVETRNHVQCLQRWKKVLRPGLKKGHWGPEEDELLRRLVEMNGKDKWGEVASQISGRTAKQCRERWWHHLDPCVKKGGWSEMEDALILAQHAKIGNRWSAISKMLPGRTENAVKIRWKSLHRRGRTRGDRFADELPASTRTNSTGASRRRRARQPSDDLTIGGAFMSGLGANMRKGSFAGDALGMGGLNPYSNFALGGPGFGLAGSAFGGLVPLNSMSMQMQMPSQFSGRSGRADSFSAAFGGVSPREVAYSHNPQDMGGRNYGRSRGASMELGGLGSFGDPIAPLIGSGGGLEPPGGLADTSFTSVGWSSQQPPSFMAYPPLVPSGGGVSSGEGQQATLMREAKPMKLSLGRSPRGHANSIDTSTNSESARMRAYSWGVPDAPTGMDTSEFSGIFQLDGIGSGRF